MNTTSNPSINLIGKKSRPLLFQILVHTLSLGLLYLIGKLYRPLLISINMVDCSFSEADVVVLIDNYGTYHILNVTKKHIPNLPELKRYIKGSIITIVNTPYGRLLFDHKQDRFVLPIYKTKLIKNFNEFYQSKIFKNSEEEHTEILTKRLIYGKNTMHVTPPTPLDIFIDQTFNLYFVWELMILTLNVLMKCYQYAIVSGVIYFYIYVTKMVHKIRVSNRVKKTSQIGSVSVLRHGKFVSIPETDIYPGDIIYIDVTENFKCDAEVINGDIIVDESSLTGESVPICKEKGGIAYSGTRVIRSKSTTCDSTDLHFQKLVRIKNLTKSAPNEEHVISDVHRNAKNLAIGRVIRTGKRTKYGCATQNLILQRPANDKFRQQSQYVIVRLLLFVLVVCIAFSFYFSRYASTIQNMEMTLDLAFTFFNPSLDTTLELGISHISKNLQRKKIRVRDMERINIAGDVDLAVFDKTGTLTETMVDILCVDSIDATVKNFSALPELIRVSLSSCHYVLELDNQYSGDVLDIKMFLFSNSSIDTSDKHRRIIMNSKSKFEPTCKEEDTSLSEQDCLMFYHMEESNRSGRRAGSIVDVLQIYDFDSNLKRMSVVVEYKGRRYLFCKGAPDSLSKIFRSVPEEYTEKIKDYGLRGYRTLAMGCREIVQTEGRAADERDLEFLCLVVFSNQMKPETNRIIAELNEAEIKTKMCTGDSILTGISAAYECGMIRKGVPVLFPMVDDEKQPVSDIEWCCVAEEDYIFDKMRLTLHDEFDPSMPIDFVVACEGREYEYLRNTLHKNFILENGVVFARFTPENKKTLVEDYCSRGLVTLYCGDGVNDAGALASASIGLSLSSNVSSLAASFSAESISALLCLIKEGRSCLTMSSAQFQFAFFSQTLLGVQLIVLAPFLFIPSDLMSVITDIAGVYVLGYALAHFPSARKLSVKKPSLNIIRPIVKTCYQLVFILVVFATIVMFFRPKNLDGSEIQQHSKPSTMIYLAVFSLFLYKSYTLSDFRPYRGDRSRNIVFSLTHSFFAVLGLSIGALAIYGRSFVLDWLGMVPLSFVEKIVMFACILAVLGGSLIIDKLKKTGYS